MSNTTALTIIAICQIVYAVVGLLAVLGIIYAIFALKKMVSDKIDEAFNRIQPVVNQAQSIAEQARETSEKVSAKVDAIMSKAENTADQVSNRVVTATNKVESAINPQVASTAGMIGAAIKAYQLYQDFLKIKQTVQSKPASTTHSSVSPDTTIETELETHI